MAVVGFCTICRITDVETVPGKTTSRLATATAQLGSARLIIMGGPDTHVILPAGSPAVHCPRPSPASSPRLDQQIASRRGGEVRCCISARRTAISASSSSAASSGATIIIRVATGTAAAAASLFTMLVNSVVHCQVTIFRHVESHW